MMTVVKLFKIDDLQQDPVAVFDDGEYTVGRSPFLTDKRISRQHGLLKVSKDAVTLTAVHQNPCYYKTENGSIKMLLKGETVTLQDNGEFSFLKENSWLKVVISDDTITENITESINDETSCNKRKNSFDSPQTTQKIARTEESAEANSCEINDFVSSEKVENGSATAEIKNEPLDEEKTIKEDADDQAALDVIVAQINKEVKEEVTETASCASTCVKEEINQDQPEQNPAVGDDGEDKGKPKRNWRDRCWYGKKCYRKNTEHKATFSHPGDSDYDTDPEDNRPSCSFGAACYRRNSIHRRDYKHPSNGGKQPKTKRKPKKRTENSTLDEGDEEDDEYDLEDPFINDDSEDDFEPDEDDDDTDWEDSQEMNDEEEDTKQLLKEAKRITRNKGNK